MKKNKKKLLIIDSNSVIHRAYHALPPLTTKKGELVNALYGFLLVFLKALHDFQPDYLAAAFDYPALTFRHKKFKEYKAKRPPTPKELSLQIPKVKQALKVFSAAVLEKKGFEADDIIGAIAGRSKIENIILSGDSDIFQLVNPLTKVYFLKRGVKDISLYDEQAVKEKFQGLLPEQLIDFKALKGDSADNIPGVSGIGEKTALILVLQFNNLDNLYKEIKGNSPKSKQIKLKTKEILLRQEKQAFFSKTLVKIKKNMPLKFNLEDCSRHNYSQEKAVDFLKKFEFYSLIEKLEKEKPGQEHLIVANLKLW